MGKWPMVVRWRFRTQAVESFPLYATLGRRLPLQTLVSSNINWRWNYSSHGIERLKADDACIRMQSQCLAQGKHLVNGIYCIILSSNFSFSLPPSLTTYWHLLSPWHRSCLLRGKQTGQQAVASSRLVQCWGWPRDRKSGWASWGGGQNA